MQRITIAFTDETIESLECIAAQEHDGDLDEATRTLLETWLEDHRSTT